MSPLPVIAWLRRLLTDPASMWQLIALVIVGEAALSTLIVRFVPYTEIDWIAYCQEVEGFLGGDTNYANLKGDTGPLVYPAGFVYIYAALYWLTDSGRNIFRAQILFGALYVATVGMVARIYQRASGKHMPNWVILLLCISKRVHSIYMLRLFNDGIAMLIFYISVILLIEGQLWLANIGLSLAVSVKMNILLFAPSWLIILWHAVGFWATIPYLALCAAIQLILAYPFLSTHPIEYMRGAFDFGRVFFFKWTVNWKFLDESVFVSKELAVLLLATHLSLLVFYLHRYACHSEGGLFRFIGKLVSGLTKPRLPSPQFIVTTLFFGNFLGVMCARSLHYQFYSWVFFSLPYLLWQTTLPVVVRLLVLGAIEVCWNVFPAQPWSSALLLSSHILLCFAFFISRHSTPHPFPTSAGEIDSKDAKLL